MPSTNTAQQPSNAPPPYFSGSDTEEGSSADEEYRQSLRAPGVDLTRVRSAQDEELPLPDGWIRQYDPNSEHHFYVDTAANPPRSIWEHPFQDAEFIKSIPDTERDSHTSANLPSSSSAAAAGGERHSARDPRAYAPGGVPQEQHHQQQPAKHEEKSFGDKLKQRITGKTKEERAARRREKAAAERAEQERLEKAYAARRALLRQQMNDPRFVQRYSAPTYAYNRGPYLGGGYSRYGGGYPGYNGVGMPLGYGGYGRRGMGMGMPLMGGLGGGLLLGSMMGGGFGGGYGGGFGGDCGGGGDGGGGGD